MAVGRAGWRMSGLLGLYPDFPEAEGDSHFVLSTKAQPRVLRQEGQWGEGWGPIRPPTSRRASPHSLAGWGLGLWSSWEHRVGIRKDLGLQPPHRSHSQWPPQASA